MQILSGKEKQMTSLFHVASKFTYDWLLNQPHVKEESLTDWLLYYLSENNKRILYLAFSRNEESTIGADWEWWILLDDNTCKNYSAYRFLVQAKKLKKDADNYPLFSYSNRNGLQMDLLLESAKYRHALPLYMHYSTAWANYNQQIKAFPTCKNLLEKCKECDNGCFLSPAILVKDIIFDAPRTKIDEHKLVNSAIGLSVFDYVIEHEYVYEWLKDINLFYKKMHCDEENQYSRNGIDGIRHYSDGIPGYINSIVRYPNEGLDWIESEFRREFEDLSGISIIDLRTKK